MQTALPCPCRFSGIGPRRRPVEAAEARDRRVIEMGGEYSQLNFLKATKDRL